MKKKIIITLVLIWISLLVTGCWSRKELNDLAIATALGIDKVDDQYLVSIQIVNPSEVATKVSGGGYQTPVTVYSTTSTTVFGAIRKLTTITPRKVYLAQLRTIVFGEELAREGIGPVLDYLARDREIREEDIFMLIAKDGAAIDSIQILTHLDKIPAMKIYGALKTLEKYWAPVAVVQLSELMFDLSDGRKYPVIPGVIVVGDKEQGNPKKNVESVASPVYLQFANTAAFHKDKLVGWLNETESKGYNYLGNRVIKTAGDINCPNGGTMTLDIIRSNTKLKGHVKNGMPQIEVDIRMEGNIADVQCEVNLMDPKIIEELEKIGSERVKEIIQIALNKVQKELKTDIFGFGDVIHRGDSREWKKIKKDWEQIFPDVPVNIDVKLFIRNMGTEDNSIYSTEEGDS